MNQLEANERPEWIYNSDVLGNVSTLVSVNDLVRLLLELAPTSVWPIEVRGDEIWYDDSRIADRVVKRVGEYVLTSAGDVYNVNQNIQEAFLMRESWDDLNHVKEEKQ